MFHTATPEQIKGGKITDVYFVRTLEILKAKGIDKNVKAEFIAKNLPQGWEWAVFAGLEECIELAKDLKVNVRAMPEGSIFKPFEPVMEIEGMYTAFCIYETALLGFICQASGIATQSARCKKLTGDRLLLSFGARRMHPSLAPMIERNAFIGGCDGVSAIGSAELIGENPMGTMPHALILLLGSTVEAIKAFHKIIDQKVKRVALIDTLTDEKFEAINVAEAMGRDLYAVRLDTPGSRRGDFFQILKEVRWELDIRGFQHVKLFVSGGIDEAQIKALNPVVDGYGIGTYISNAPVIDFAMDIVDVEGRPLAKRGKWGGSKDVYRCETCHEDQIVPSGKTIKQCECGGKMNPLVKPILSNGDIKFSLPSPQAIREFVLKQIKDFHIM